MRLFDRYAKLRAKLRTGRLIDEPKEMLPRLKGTLTKEDLPAAIVEPGDLEELRATLEFAAEKHVKIAVASGLAPTAIRDLKERILLLTTRLSQAPIISTVRGTARVSAGFPVESLAIDLFRDNLDWKPLWPVPTGKSVGSLLAAGREGVRCFRNGGTMCHVNFIEWMGFDGRIYSAGPSISSFTVPDISGSLFGSRGALGIITGAELALCPAMKSRSAAVLEFSAAEEAAPFFADLAVCSPIPETILFWGSTATDIIRQGNDGTLSDLSRFTVLVEWDQEDTTLPPPWDSYAKFYPDETSVRALWQDVLRMPKTTSRMYPGQETARVRLSAEAIAPLEEAASDFGRDANLTVAVWGTPDVGYVYIWVLLPDTEHVTQTRARETMQKLVEVAVSLGGSRATGAGYLPPTSSIENGVADSLRINLRDKCDPVGLHEPLHSE